MIELELKVSLDRILRRVRSALATSRLSWRALGISSSDPILTLAAGFAFASGWEPRDEETILTSAPGLRGCEG